MRTLAAQLELLSCGEASSVELVERAISSAQDVRHAGAWELVDEDGARSAAVAADRARARGDTSPLLGVPLGVKDVIDVGGLPTRAGSASWSRSPTRDAAAVAKLREAGAVVLGKTHTVEWAYGIDGLNPHRPPCLNPRAPDRLPGGSSSGSAAAVAAGTVTAALGTDTSGSVRVPAAFCGVVGLRPTFGAISTEGVVPLAPSYDVVGPIAASVADVAIMFAALAGRALAPGDPTRFQPPRIGVVEALLELGVSDPHVAAALHSLEESLRRRGAKVERIVIPGLQNALGVHRAIQLREAADVHAELGTDPGTMAPSIRERLASGAVLDPAAVVDARRERARISASLDAALVDRDALLAPAVTVLPPLRDDPSPSLRDTLLSATVPFTQHLGPALVLPAAPPTSACIGVQLVGRRGDDAALLQLAMGWVEGAWAGEPVTD
jgi:aspartyl-tRNA(Asn)/glutamyl-tRNA(Gln) amidotransferase subunit A